MNVSIVQKNQNTVDFAEAEKVAEQLGLNVKLVELLFLRGICDVDSVRKFLYPEQSMFYDPFLMKGMKEATNRINQAISAHEKVIIYGDYDADGVCAAAILSLFLSKRGLEVYVHIPNRVGDGYGLNTDTLERIIETHMPDLIITCDCGISGAEEVAFAMDLGVDMIVTDHHEISGAIPECIVVNPKQEDCDYPFNMLCGAGVALKVVEALSSQNEMMEYTDLACVATIADLMPLVDENRLIVQFGLENINRKRNLGLAILFDNLGLENVTAGDIAYKVAPRINAAGRMGDAYRAFELITSTDVSRVNRIASEIDRDNIRRKEMCDEMYNEAVEDLRYEDLINSRAIILSHPSWEKGITGILAARLAGDYIRPTFIMVKSGETYKGTCRSVEGINVHDLLWACREHLVEFGGHSQAAGFSILPQNIPAFSASVNRYLSDFSEELFMPKAYYDMEIEPSDVKYDFVTALNMLEPTGSGNPKPLFKLELDETKVAPCKNNQAHISVTLDSGFQFFAFNYAKLSYQLLANGKKTVVTELQTSNYGGKQIKGIMRCCSPENLFINDSVCEGYAYGLLGYLPKDNCEYELYDENELNALEKRLYGTLIIAFNRVSYEKYIAAHDYPQIREFTFATTRNNFSRIIVAPSLDSSNISLSNYDKIVFLDAPLNNGVVSYLNSVTKAKIYLPKDAANKYDVSAEREVFIKYYEAIRNAQGVRTASLNGFYRYLAKNTDGLNIEQFMFCVRVFEELGIIEISESPFMITVNKGKKVDLNSSEIYKVVKERN